MPEMAARTLRLCLPLQKIPREARLLQEALWFKFMDDSLWSASHENSYIVKQLKNNGKVSFEISTNEYPYKGEPLAKRAV